MARAKKTDRAEARRRHRALMAQAAQAEAAGPSESTASTATEPASPPPGSLGGILSSIRRPDLLADLRAVPSLIRSRRWLLVPYGLVIVGAGLATTTTATSGSIEASAVALLLAQPTLLYFLVGYLAPRGSYIFGAVLGLLASVLYVTIVLARLGPEVTGSGGDLASGALSYVLIQVVSGALFAGFASWYRGFLRSATERNRQRAEERRRMQEREARRSAAKSPSARPVAGAAGQAEQRGGAPLDTRAQGTARRGLSRFLPGR